MRIIVRYRDNNVLPGIVIVLSPRDAGASGIGGAGEAELVGGGAGRLIYDAGDNLYASGLNMIMIFGKVSEGLPAGPEDFSKLMVECNGPLTGTMGSDGMEAALTVLPKN